MREPSGRLVHLNRQLDKERTVILFLFVMFTFFVLIPAVNVIFEIVFDVA